MNQKNFVLHTYIHQARKLEKEHPSHFSHCMSVYSTCFKGTLVFHLYFCSNGIFLCCNYFFFQLILLFLKHTFLSFETLSTAPWCPQNAAEMSPQLPFPLLSLSCTAPLLFHVLQTDSQASGYTSSLSPAPSSTAGPATMSTRQEPTLFLRFSLKTEASTCFPCRSLFGCLCFQLKLSFCFCVE